MSLFSNRLRHHSHDMYHTGFNRVCYRSHRRSRCQATTWKIRYHHSEPKVSSSTFVTRVVMVPTRTMNLEVELSLPSKEGLNVNSVISILAKLCSKLEVNGMLVRYEDVLILSVFRSSTSAPSSMPRHALWQSLGY